MQPITTDWHPGDPPLADRPGEYETQVGETIARRWWDGETWSMPYLPDDPPHVVAQAQSEKLPGASVVWRGMSHRFVIGQTVRHGKFVSAISNLRPGPDGQGWTYEMTSTQWPKTSWVSEDQLEPASPPGET